MNPSDDAHKLFVAGLPDGITEEVLRDLFAESGTQVMDVSVPRDRMTGRPRGFAFVRLSSPEDVDHALSILDGHVLGGTSISVRRFKAEPPVRGDRPMGGSAGGPPSGGSTGFNRGPAADTSDRTLYVGNLPYDTTQEEVEGMLNEAGAGGIVRVHLPIDPEGRRRGFGFVTVESPEGARAAVDQLRGATLRGRPLVVNLALPRAAPGGAPGAGPSRMGGPRSSGPMGPSMGPGGPGPAANRFGPPAKPAAARDFSRKKKPEGEAGPGRAGRAARRDGEAHWKVDDDE